MSERRDEGWEKMEELNIKEEETEKEKKTCDVSEEHNPVSSNPSSSVVAAAAAAADKQTPFPSWEEDDVAPPFKKPKQHVRSGHHGQGFRYHRIDSEPELSRYATIKEDTGGKSTPSPSMTSNIGLNLIDFVPYNWDSKHMICKSFEKHFLFKKTLSNPCSKILYIPEEIALAHFLKAKILLVLYLENSVEPINFPVQWWPMKLVYWPLSKSYAISTGWKAFVDAHKLEAGNVIRFYKGRHDLESKRSYHRYFIDCLKGGVQDSTKTGLGIAEPLNQQNSLPKRGVQDSTKTGIGIAEPQNQQNSLFGKILSRTDVNGRLNIPKDDAEKHFFPPDTTENEKVLELVDPQDKDWAVTLKKYTRGFYRISDYSWGLFVKKHNLEAGDQVIFYKADDHQHSDSNQYLIRFKKRNKVAASGTEAEDQDKGIVGSAAGNSGRPS